MTVKLPRKSVLNYYIEGLSRLTIHHSVIYDQKFSLMVKRSPWELGHDHRNINLTGKTIVDFDFILSKHFGNPVGQSVMITNHCAVF